MASVYIPVQNSEEEVRVSLDQLPRDASDILDILKAEQAPLDLWLIIAREYFKQGKLEQFRQILEEGSSHEIDEYYADVRYERIAILNALGAYYSYLGKIETRTREKEEYFIQATKHYNKASRIDMHESSTWVGKGQLLLAKGELDQASAAFKIVLEGDRENVSALLGQACVEYNRGRYCDSLAIYKRVLQVHPKCPGAVRLGIGHCHYKLGRLGKARMAFERVLQLDPDNVEALVSLAILDLQTNEASGIRRGMKRMHIAFEAYPYCAMALNYLANHFFFTGQHFLVEQLTESALSATTHGPTKSHSYFNLARSYHSKGDYEKAAGFYRYSIQEINTPQEFIFPYYGLGQVQLKLGEIKNALSNFEKVLEVHPDNCETLKVLGHIYSHLGQSAKAQELLRKATKIDPRDAQAFLDLGELLISSDKAAALDAFKTARELLRKGGEDVPIEVLNNIAVINFARDELELSLQVFKEALGDGIWLSLLDGKAKKTYSRHMLQFKDLQFFQKLEEDGHKIDVPWNKVTVLFNLARLLEQMHQTQAASDLYHLILYKFPNYEDCYLRLAAIAKSRNNLQRSIDLVNESLKANDKYANALSMLGDFELKNDDWVKAKETLRTASEVAGGKDSYSVLSLGNWNYFAALRNEKRNPKLEATHLEKAKELFSKVLVQHNSNLYAANGAAIVLAEKGQFDVAKDLFTQIQEVASGNTLVPMPDVWINLAHVYFAQGNFASAVKMYQNCSRRFFYNTDFQIHLYLARTHYEAEEWQDCKKCLLRAIHLAPSNYTLRFDAGVTMQKSSASMLLKEKRTSSELRSTVNELENAVRLFSQLSAASNLNIHGFDEKKINTHVEYCKHLLEASKVHYEAALELELQTRQRQEVARREAEALEARRNAEEQWKVQLERRKQEDMFKQVMQQEEHLERLKEQWKTSGQVSKRKDRSDIDGEDGVVVEKRRRKGGKKRKKEKASKLRYEIEGESDMIDYQEELEDEDINVRYRPPNETDDNDDNAQELLAAAGLEDSDAEDEAAPSSGRRKRAWSESEDDEQSDGKPVASPAQANSGDLHESDR